MSAEKRGCQLHLRRFACSFLGKRPLLSAIVAHSAGPLTLLFSPRRVKIRSLRASWNNKQTEVRSRWSIIVLGEKKKSVIKYRIKEDLSN